MKYEKARQIIAEARKTFAQRSASLIGRMGGSPDEVRQGITGKRTPAAKGGRALLTKAYKDAERKREKDPYFPYGKAETRRMSKYMSEARRMRSRPGVVADRVDRIQAKFEADMKTGKATEDMLKRIVNHHADAVKKYHVERADARTQVENKIRHAHHKMRAEHYKTHIRNYEKHYANAYKAHQAGDFKKAWAEGSHASSGPHLRDVPYHADYHVASYHDKK